jgi:hypothetical protein
MEDLDTTGPVCHLLSTSRQELGQPAEIIEVKYTADQLLSWATRGIGTLDAGTDDSGKPNRPKVAKRGMHEPKGDNTNVWVVRTALTRTPKTRWIDSGPMAFTTSYMANADHIFIETPKRVTFEFDYKRQLLEPSTQSVTFEGDRYQHIAAYSEPWSTIEAFNSERDLFDQWRARQGGQLISMDDWDRWRDFRAGDAASKSGVRRCCGGVLAQVIRVFTRAYVRREWGLPGGCYKDTANALTAAGYPVTQDAFKNAARRYRQQPTPENTIPSDGDGVTEFVSTLERLWPGFDSNRMLEHSQNESP